MDIEVMCIDADNAQYEGYQLQKGKIYSVRRITASYRGHRRDRYIRNLFYELRELPSLNFHVKRFEVIGKININLPDDVYNLPLI